MKRRSWKKFGIVLGILAIILLVVIVVLPLFMDLNRYNGLIVSEIQEAVGGRASLGHLSWGISNGIWLEADGFSSVDATAFPADLKLSRIYAKVSILPLLTKKIVLKKVLLEGSEVNIRLAPSTARKPASTAQKAKTPIKEGSQPATPQAEASGTEVSDSTADGPTGSGFQLPLAIEIEQLAVEIGRLELDDALTLPGQTQERVFSDVDLAATNLVTGKEMAFTIALRDKDASGLGELKAQGTFAGLTESLTLKNPKLTMKLKLSALHTDAIKPYLRNSPLAQRLAGNVSLAVNYEGDLISNHRAAGDIDLSLITYSDPSLWDAPPTGAGTTVTYVVNLNPDALMVEKLALKLGKLSLKASGEVHNWHKDPLIKNVKFSSDLPLPELIPLMPWKLLGQNAAILRPILESGGKIVVEQAVLPAFDPAKPPATVEAFLTGINMTAQVSGVSVQSLPDLPKIEGATGRIKFEKGVLTATDMRTRLGLLSLPSLPDVSIRVTHITEGPKVTVRAKGPLQIEASSDAIAAKLLMAHGLKSLSGSVVVDMSADFDLRKPKSWVANGSFIFKGVRAETYPKSVVMDNLKGNVKFNRNKTLNITAQDITAQINQAPVRLSGKLLKVGTPNPVVAAKAFTKQLDLAHLVELMPALKRTGLAGKLDMDLDVHIPYATPTKGRLNGTLATKNVRFKLASYDVKNGDIELTLAGNTAKIDRLQIRVNDLALAAKGRITNPVEPDIFLAADMPNLDIDRLLPPAKSEKKSSKVPPKEETRVAQKAELPSIARKATADLQFKARQGRYKGIKFENLKLDAVYENGVVKQYYLKFGIDDGRFATNGSADLRDLERVEFVLRPKVTSLRLEKVAPVLGIEQLPISGPISLVGQMRGRTGTTRDLLASLEGDLKTEMGPGLLTKIGKAGEIILKILTMTSVKSILSRRMIDDLDGGGLPYHTIKAGTTFSKGNLVLNNFSFVSDAMNMHSQGSINLVDERMNIKAELEPFTAADKVFGMVPVLGEHVEKKIGIDLHLKGSLDNPEIGVVLVEGVVDAVKGAKKKSGTILKGFTDFLKKEKNK
jgi:uncharacterized protein involved in outer membrane biogenesis